MKDTNNLKSIWIISTIYYWMSVRFFYLIESYLFFFNDLHIDFILELSVVLVTKKTLKYLSYRVTAIVVKFKPITNFLDKYKSIIRALHNL